MNQDNAKTRAEQQIWREEIAQDMREWSGEKESIYWLMLIIIPFAIVGNMCYSVWKKITFQK